MNFKKRIKEFKKNLIMIEIVQKRAYDQLMI